MGWPWPEAIEARARGQRAAELAHRDEVGPLRAEVQTLRSLVRDLERRLERAEDAALDQEGMRREAEAEAERQSGLREMFQREAGALADEVDRLRDGIRRHRDHDFTGDPFETVPTRKYVGEIRTVNERLWALIEEGDDDR